MAAVDPWAADRNASKLTTDLRPRAGRLEFGPIWRAYEALCGCGRDRELSEALVITAVAGYEIPRPRTKHPTYRRPPIPLLGPRQRDSCYRTDSGTISPCPAGEVLVTHRSSKLRSAAELTCEAVLGRDSIRWLFSCRFDSGGHPIAALPLAPLDGPLDDLVFRCTIRGASAINSGEGTLQLFQGTLRAYQG